jgi:hypothetical protein
MNRSIVLLVLVVLSATARAQTGPTRVLVVRTDQEPACLDRAALASAISRHSAFPSQTVAEDPPNVEGVVEVRVERDASRVAVRIEGGGHELKRTLESAPCETMADVIAAFVASVLAPAPDIPVPTPGPSPASSSSPTSEQLTAEAHARVERGALFAAALSEYTPEPQESRAGHVVVMGVTLAFGALSLATSDEDFGPGHVLVAGGMAATLVGGLVGAVPLGGEHSEAISNVGYALGFGALIGSRAFFDEEIDDSSVVVQRDTFHESDLVFGASVALAIGWRALDRAHLRPTSRALVEIKKRIATPQQRATLTDAELASYERTFRASKTPEWRYMIPVVAGAATCFLLMGRETNSAEEDRALRNGAILSGLAVLQAVIALHPHPATRYDRQLRKAGVDLTVAPLPAGAALSMGGRF